MNKKLAVIIKRAEQNWLGGDKIVQTALRAHIPIAQVIRGVKKAGYPLHWGLWINGDKRRGLVPEDLIKVVDYAWEKGKTANVEIWFSRRDDDQIPDQDITAALKREVRALNQKS